MVNNTKSKKVVETMPDEDNNEYEMIPRKLLSDLQYDVEALKKKLTQPDTKVDELILEIETLKGTLQEMNSIFQKALEDIKNDGDLNRRFEMMTEKIEAVVSQNETIARGMIAISDKLEDFMNKQKQPIMQMQRSSPSTGMQQPGLNPVMPQMPGPGRVAPFPSAEPTMSSGEMDFPPPPPGMKKRTGLF
jgi:hypothetical protein